MKVKEVYDKMRELENHINKIGSLIVDARASDTDSITVEEQFLYTMRIFLYEYISILGRMDIKEEE